MLPYATENQLKTLKNSVSAVENKLGGLTLIKLTQAEYDALTTKDASTLYVIVG